MSKLRGVVVGINKYKDLYFREKPLYYARTDAEDVAGALHSSNAFHVDDGQLKLLVGEMATQEAVWRSLNQVFKPGLNGDQDTIAFFYFAGHGTIDSIEGDEVLLACHNVEYRNPQRGGIRLNAIYNLVQRTSAGCSIAIIDACFSGSVLDLKRIDHESADQLARRAIELVRAQDGKSIAIFASCSSGQRARESEDLKHGIYTFEFLRGLRDGEARDAQGIVDIDELAAYLRRQCAHMPQGPRSVVLGSKRVPLWIGEPRAPGSTPAPQVIQPSRTLTDLSGDRVEIVTGEIDAKDWLTPFKQGRLKWLSIGVLFATLFLCGTASILVEPIRIALMAAIFLGALLLPLGALRLSGILTTILFCIQVVLLGEYAHLYFGWHSGISPLDVAVDLGTGFAWIIWLVLGIEFVGLVLTPALKSLDVF